MRFDAVKKYRMDKSFRSFSKIRRMLRLWNKTFLWQLLYLKKKSIKICTRAADERKQRSPEGGNELNINNSLRSSDLKVFFYKILVKTLYLCPIFRPFFFSTANFQMSIKSEPARDRRQMCTFWNQERYNLKLTYLSASHLRSL